ncbi:flippase [Paenibacillus pseudetheri]|uniref:Polysaccharide biosynthesis protein C-terminal domain-containing protein n=1 Tax=Paenibacillus pseudetheri TaxID=2897682 RepID=A0ABN8FR28_9BACL|nr:flippase [Paenibacillus pseudetheri]CAH1057994.1 hypothetical protein PAECIP111894_04167 [Paenibacillus pseudetheri]
MSKFAKNLSWIFAGNLVHAILQFLLNILIARVLTTADYGLINYSASLIAFFTSLGTLGFNGIITKKISDEEDKAEEYLGSAIIYRLIFSIFAIISLQIIVRIFDPNNTKLHTVVFFQSITIFFGAFDLIVYFFRYTAQAKVVEVLRLAAFFLSAFWRLIVLATYKSITLYVLGTSIESVFFAVFLVFAFVKIKKTRFKFRNSTAISLMRLSYPFISSAIMTTIYGQVDKIMLNNMIDSTAVAYFSVSLTLAGAISIIPSALIEGFRPDIMASRNRDIKKYHKRLKQLYCMVFWICITYCLFITIFAKDIVLILYGDKYLPAVSSMSLIVWYTSFSYFGAINNMYMVAENKVKWVQVITLVGAILNVLLNFILIPYYGIVGAATASLITQIVANFILLAFIPSLRENFKIIVKGITFQR